MYSRQGGLRLSHKVSHGKSEHEEVEVPTVDDGVFLDVVQRNTYQGIPHTFLKKILSTGPHHNNPLSSVHVN